MDAAPSDTGFLLARIREGDESAAGDLVVRLHPLVMKIVRAHLPVRLAEEDLAQEVFQRLFARLDQYHPRAGIPFEHWVSRLAVRTCLDAVRAERRRPEIRWTDLPDGEAGWLEYLVAEGTASPPGTEADARDLVERLLAQMTPEDRLVISLLDLQELSVAEIAARTGWSAVGVRVRAFRARRRLGRLASSLGIRTLS